MKFQTYLFTIAALLLVNVATEDPQSPQQNNQSPQQNNQSPVQGNIPAKQECITSTITIPAKTVTLPPQQITVFATAAPKTYIRKCKPKNWNVVNTATEVTKGNQSPIQINEPKNVGKENNAGSMIIIVGDGGLKFGPNEMK
ncbi:hypothetical protein HK099_002405, partial [Clydaea vesicula]